MPGHLRIGHVVPVDDVEHSLLRDGVSIPEDATSPTCRGRATRSLEALYTKDRQGSSARGRRRPARPHPCQMPTPDPRCCRECRPQDKDRRNTERWHWDVSASSLRRFRVQKVGQAARETMLKFVGVSLALLESKEGVFPSRRGWATAGDKTSTVSSERSMARLRVSMFFYLGSLKRHTLWHTCPEPPMSQSKVSRAKVASAQLTILISASCSSTGKEHQTRIEGRGCAYRRVGQCLVDKLRVIKVPHLSCHPAPCQDVHCPSGAANKVGSYVRRRGVHIHTVLDGTLNRTDSSSCCGWNPVSPTAANKEACCKTCLQFACDSPEL